MAGLLDRMTSRRQQKDFVQPPFWASDGLSDASSSGSWGGWGGLFASPSGTTEMIDPNYGAFIDYAYKASGPVFSVIRFRQSVLSEARFQWRQFIKGRPGELFGSSELSLLENPWPSGTTGNLITRMEVTSSLAGNYYATVADDRGRVGRTATGPGRRIVHMRPDWVTIVIDSASGNPNALDARIVGYIYRPPPSANTQREDEALTLLPEEVCHFAPITDPGARFRGMSWLTPIVEEVRSDKAATAHKTKFFQNGAVPNMAIVLGAEVGPDDFSKYVKKFKEAHQGADNAYKCLHPDTDVAMWDGRRVLARDVASGDLAVAWSADGKPVPGTVSTAEWQPDSPIVTVTTQRGRVIRTNDRHPFLVGGRWVDAEHLRPGDLLTTGLGWGDGGMSSRLSGDEAWMLGVLTGDGCMVGTTPVISAWDQGVQDRLARSYEIRRTGKGYDYRVLGITKLVRSAGMTGKRSWEKRIPDVVMTGSVEERAAFLSGLIDTDGHVSDPKTRSSMELGITSVSRELLRDAQHLLASLGINSSVSCSMPAREGRGRDAWRLCAFGNEQARRLAEMLDLSCLSKANRLAVYANTPMVKQQDRSRSDRVVSVEISEPEATIGIEVADHHTHITGGVVTHNTLFLAGGADVRPLSADFRQMDFKPLQALAETRIASAAGIHPTVVGMSEGLQGSSLNSGNFNAAVRLVANGTLRPWWRDAAASLSTLVTSPVGGASLWYDDRDIAFLREDATDQAGIQQMNAAALKSLTDAGFKPDAAIAYLQSGDMNRLIGQHSGLYSVQLQPPNTTPLGAEPPAPPALPA